MEDLSIDVDALKQRLQEELRNEFRKEFAKKTVITVLSLLAISVVGWWFYLKPVIIKAIGGVPEGGVVAFDRNRCPDGWVAFADANGRTIIGAGNADGLSPRPYRAHGDTETVTLNPKHLPPHKHLVPLGAQDREGEYGHSQSKYWVVKGGGEIYFPRTYSGPSSGEGKEFSIMPPFLALHYCVRATG